MRVTSFGRVLTAALAVCASLGMATAASGQLGGLIGGLVGGSITANPGPIEMQTGRMRTINNRGDQATEIADGAAISADFANASATLYGRNYRVAVYAFAGTAGQTVTVRAASPDVYPVMWITRTLAGVMGQSAAPVAGGPREAVASATIKQTGPHFVVIYGVNTRPNGKLDYGNWAAVGRYTISVGDSTGAPPVVARAAGAVPGAAPAAASNNAAPSPAGTSLEATYARLCSDEAAAANETCAALKQAMIAKLTGKPAASAGMPARPGTGPRAAAGRAPAVKPPVAPKAVGPIPAAVPGAAPPPVDPAAWQASEAAMALPANSFTRSFTTPVGRNTKFEVKLPRGQSLEVVMDMAGAAGTVQACFIPDALLGSAEGFCPVSGVATNEIVVARFRQDRPGEVQVKVTGSSGKGTDSYRVLTRPDLPGRGPALLTRLERLAGRTYVSEGQDADGVLQQFALTYRVEQPGRSGVLVARPEAGAPSEVRFTLTPDGDLLFDRAGGKGVVTIGGDGRFYVNDRGGRFGYAIAADGTLSRLFMSRISWGALRGESAPDLGGFSGSDASTARFAVTAEPTVLAMLARGPKRVAALKAARLFDWGVLGQMAGRDWIYPNYQGTRFLTRYAWEREGYVLTAKYWMADTYGIGEPAAVERLVRDPKTGRISGSCTGCAGGTAVSSRAASVTDIGNTVLVRDNVKSVLSMAGPNDVLEEQTDGKTPPTRYQAVDKLQIASLAERARQLKAQREAQVAAQQQQGGGGFLGVLNQGLQMYNLATNQQAYQAALVGKMNELAPGLGEAMQAAAGAANGGGVPAAGGIAGTGGGAGGAGRASYPTRGNLALGPQCPGFTTDNYQSRASQGGGDTQLFTMCAQAFHLYRQYLNAIAQGYSEADANRTYDAHSKAAQVANNFYATAR